jgi:transposase-like protein
MERSNSFPAIFPRYLESNLHHNAIESVNYTIQKIIKNRQSFPNDESTMKLIFMGLQHIAKKWTMPVRDWGAALNQFAIIIYGDRVPLLYCHLHKKIISS